ncbi:hypothetical protein EBZ37_14240, partial [bacterium]|nr:hypothetical protein [bacterium]
RELAELLTEFRPVPELSAEDARPLDRLNATSEAQPGRSEVFTKNKTPEAFRPFVTPTAESAPPKPSIEVLQADITKLFSGSSIFTLKRVLGEWGLKVLALHREESRERMRDWYADFAVKQAKKSVDFGLSLRRNPSREFHRQWADQVSDDLIRWEVLNRLHRILNAAQVQGG